MATIKIWKDGNRDDAFTRVHHSPLNSNRLNVLKLCGKETNVHKVIIVAGWSVCKLVCEIM